MEQLLDFVKELSFVRTGGSKEEKHAADLLLQQLRQAGGEGTLFPFSIPWAELEECSLTALGRNMEAVPYLRSGCIDRELKFLYLERGDELDFLSHNDLSDTAVLINELNEDAYRLLVKHHAAAFLVVSGKYWQDAKAASLYPKALRDHFARHGVIPGAMISGKDATALVQEQVKTVRLTIRQQDIQLDSQNVVAVIEGTDKDSEAIVLTAHYDSVPVGTGSWDNATGTAALLGIYRHFVKNPAKRRMYFIWCGSEELGLLGSRAFVEQKKELLEQIQFCFNFDMCGTALGPNQIFVTGSKELETFITQFCRREGYSASIRTRVHSSDSAPFADQGIPALGLSRGTSTSEIHTQNDLMPPLNEAAIQRNVDFAVKVIGEVANAALLPVEKGMPEEMKKELDRYFHREDPEKE